MATSGSTACYHALIRTHHITSRKKVSELRAAARTLEVACLLRSGGAPGVMYVEGDESGVREWVATVQRLRYKDYQLAVKPANVDNALTTTQNGAAGKATSNDSAVRGFSVKPGDLEEVASVKDFGAEMEKRGVWHWWRKGMGYSG